MRFFIQGLSVFIAAVLTSAPVFAATVRGVVSDVTGAALPLVFEQGVLTLSASTAFMRGTITKGINPLDGSALDGDPRTTSRP